MYLHLTTQRAIQVDDEITIRYTPVFEVKIVKAVRSFLKTQKAEKRLDSAYSLFIKQMSSSLY